MHTITMEVEFDPRKAAANQKKHGVSFADAESVLYDPMALTREDDDAKNEARFVSVGMGALGRVLTVVWTLRGETTRLISAREATRVNGVHMKAEYDFSNAKRGAVIEPKGKRRITIFIDDDVLAAFRARAEATGKGYQTLINEALRVAAMPENALVTVEALRRVLREELRPA